MILKMKRASLIVLDSQRDQSLRRLRRLGLLHVEQMPGTSETLSRLQEQKATLERSLSLLPLDVSPVSPPAESEKRRVDVAYCLDRAREAAEASEKIRSLRESLDKVRRDLDRLAPWGEFDPEDVKALRDKGVLVTLHEIDERQLRELEQGGARPFVIQQGRNRMRLALVRVGADAAPELEETALPERGLRRLRETREQLEQTIGAEEQRLAQLGLEKANILRGVELLAHDIRFEQTRAGMGCEAQVAYLVGYFPAKRSDELKEAARANGWGLLIEDPAPDESVPTCVENPRWVQIIEPVFKFLGTVPGYRERDISFWFLLFFSLYFAMLIGDAGYGAVMLGLTLFARLRMPRTRGPFTTLMLVLSSATIVWGVLSGTYFGIESLARNPLLSRAVIPAIASFGYNNTHTIMLICFVIGAVQLTLAHTLNFLRLFPSIKAFSDLGWIAILWGMFFVVRYMILSLPLNPLAQWLVLGGLVAVTVAGEQRGKFFRGLLVGLAKLPLKLLNSISAFADIVSYVRLFAVGLATVEISKSFNAMAGGIGFGIPTGLFAALILFFGHALNIAMGALAVIVHGIRLNMLEFSGHLGMEWTGIPYEPFRDPEPGQRPE
jgi:V/A-type H+-transporting ATPase subunit I